MEPELLATTVEFETVMSPTLEFPLVAEPLPIPEPSLRLEPELLAVTVEFEIVMSPTLDVCPSVA
jgi:hypothetical protein